MPPIVRPHCWNCRKGQWSITQEILVECPVVEKSGNHRVNPEAQKYVQKLKEQTAKPELCEYHVPRLDLRKQIRYEL